MLRLRTAAPTQILGSLAVGNTHEILLEIICVGQGALAACSADWCMAGGINGINTHSPPSHTRCFTGRVMASCRPGRICGHMLQAAVIAFRKTLLWLHCRL